MERSQQAEALFDAKFNCAQSVLAAHADSLRLDDRTCKAVSACFGAGVCRRGDTCGAVSGALMVLGLGNADQVATDPSGKEVAYRLGQDFIRRFEQKNGSVICHELLGFNLSSAAAPSPEERKQIVQARCPGYVKDATNILAEMRK